MCKSVLSVVFLFISLIFSINASAAVDNDAAIVKLRKDCTENGVTVPNCFVTYSSLNNWMTNTRNANAGALTIQVGPGTFDHFSCSNFDHLSVKGSGPNQTTFQGVNASNCFDLNMQDLTVSDWFPGPVYWSGDGSSTWTNVHLNGTNYAWTETNCGSTTSRPVHRWFASKLTSKSKTVYLAGCSENWFYGSELVLDGADFGGMKMGVMVRAANGDTTSKPEVHIYGSVLRTILAPGTSFSNMRAVYAGRNGEVHIHGTGIDVIGNDLDNDVTALYATDGGIIHATQTSYVMKTGTHGKRIRINNNGGVIKAPYLWETNVLDLGNNFASADGADRTTEIVCNGSACFPHGMIYTSACTGNGPWFDTVTNACR